MTGAAGDPAAAARSAAGAANAPWSADAYAACTAHHRDRDTALLAGIEPVPGGRLLDVGCGVGDLTVRLTRLVPGGVVTGVDAAETMVRAAQQRARPPHLTFVRGTVQQLDRVVGEATYDIVVSVAMLHWLPAADQLPALQQIRRALRPGGVFRADLGGVGQIAAARALIDEESRALGGPASPWTYPDVNGYRTLLMASGFDVSAPGWVRRVQQRRRFGDVSALISWLDSQILIAYQPQLPLDAAHDFRKRVIERATVELRRPDGSYDQDYVRLDLLVRATQNR